MGYKIKCALGFHEYEVLRVEDVTNTTKDCVLGKVLIQQCKNCGKLHHYVVLTIANLL